MKKVLFGFLSFAALTFVSCDYNDPNDGGFGDDPQSGWVQFDSDKVVSYVLSGNVTEFTVPVTLMAPVNTDGLTVDYTITDIEGSTAGYVTYTGKVEIPKNEVTGDIQFSIPATVLTSCVKYKITLIATSRANVQVGLVDDVKPIEHIVTIGKGRDSFIGSYDVFETPGDFEYTMTVEAGEDPNELILNNLYDSGAETKIYLQNVSYGSATSLGGTVNFPFFEENFLGQDAEGNDLYISNDFAGLQPDLAPTKYPVNAFDPCANTINLGFMIIDSEEALVESKVEVVMTKQ